MIKVNIHLSTKAPTSSGSAAGQALKWLSDNVEPFDKEAFDRMLAPGGPSGVDFKVRGISKQWAMHYDGSNARWVIEVEDDKIASLLVLQFNGTTE